MNLIRGGEVGESEVDARNAVPNPHVDLVAAASVRVAFHLSLVRRTSRHLPWNSDALNVGAISDGQPGTGANTGHLIRSN